MDRRKFVALAATSVAGGAILSATGLAPAQAQEQAASSLPKPRKQLMMGYYRTWGDVVTEQDAHTSMANIPDEVDVVFLSFAVTANDSRLSKAIQHTYIPLLQGQGTKVVNTIFVDKLIDPAYPNTPEGHRALAEHLVTTYVTDIGADGLDVDVERSFTTAQLAQAKGVFTELSTLLGPRADNGTLLIFDTNKSGNEPLLQHAAGLVDYVLVQSYGRNVAGLQATWETFEPWIEPHQYLIGFTFYEHRGQFRTDVTLPMETSRAYAYATWNPEGARKGGIFSYAIDRDGVAPGDDTSHPSDYSWSRELKHVMNR
ncbi:hypothetical protein GCM10009809_12360 [Isoptericola hypogeus]|uniref:mannosyl-glycoprotein endo-beta-N-acetylglucosaminidase n=1 Tax=Isoptericola hypogeus TaxID=300179 RepID=A0ABN2J4R9_9MICO